MLTAMIDNNVFTNVFIYFGICIGIYGILFQRIIIICRLHYFLWIKNRLYFKKIEEILLSKKYFKYIFLYFKDEISNIIYIFCQLWQWIMENFGYLSKNNNYYKLIKFIIKILIYSLLKNLAKKSNKLLLENVVLKNFWNKISRKI